VGNEDRFSEKHQFVVYQPVGMILLESQGVVKVKLSLDISAMSQKLIEDLVIRSHVMGIGSSFAGDEGNGA
jgi:hypothetical protein